MKRFLSIIAIAMLTVGAFAEGHMTFKGVEINGNIRDFVNQLKAKGLTVVSNDGSTAMLSGTFTGKDVKVAVYSTPISHTVHSVCVIYDGGDQWQIIKNQYTSLKEMLTQKYGEPTTVVEETTNKYATEDHYLHELMMERLTYATSFTTDKGEVLLRMAYMNLLGNMVLLCYKDKEGSKINDKELIDEL
ncbi:MAG: hypothetical protein IJ650_01710 [Paludibacteraceae bacterium]|nr:hypothetical protein [Paludibacteraceae bacterium]